MGYGAIHVTMGRIHDNDETLEMILYFIFASLR